METFDINTVVRVYILNGKVVAKATNPTWGRSPERVRESRTRYYCLKGIWEPNEVTQVVTPEQLERIGY
jgi:hypothetical protein